jgi:hypothetical protein
MKTKIIFALIAVGFTLSAFKFVENTKSTATVDQKEGIYIFMFSKPTAEY